MNSFSTIYNIKGAVFLWMLLGWSICLSGQVNFSGYINFKDSTAQSAQIYLHPTVLGTIGTSLQTTIEPNGQFQFELDLASAVPAVLEISDLQILLFLFPDKPLQISIEQKTADNIFINFYGTAAQDNQFYLNYRNDILAGIPKVPHKLLTKFSPKEYLTFQMDKKQLKLDYLNQSQNSIDLRLFNWLKNNVVYQFANNLLEYPNRLPQPRTPGKSYYDFLPAISLNNNSAILQTAYQRFIINFIDHKLHKPQKWGIHASAEEKLKFIRRYLVGETLYFYQFYLLIQKTGFKRKRNRERETKAYLASKAPDGYKRYLFELMQKTQQ